MATNQGALYFNAGIGMDGWRNNIAEMRRDLVGINQLAQNQARQIDSTFKNLAAGIATYFSFDMMKGFIMSIIEVRGEFQKTEIAFATMLQSRKAAKDLMEQMVQLAAATPFSLREVSEGAKQLLAFQVPADEVVDTLKRMGDIAAGLSVPLGRIQLVYGQVKAKGKLMGDDLRQFTEAGIPMVAELAKKFGKGTDEISAMVSAGKIGFKDVKDVLFSMTNQGGLFFNLMEKQSSSLSGRISNLGDAWDQMLNKIGEANEGVLYSGIEALTYVVEHYEKFAQILATVVATYGTYKAALIAVTAIQRAAITLDLIKTWIALARSIRSAADAQALFNLTFARTPYGAIAMALAAVVGAIVYYKTGVNEADEATKELTVAMQYQKDVNEEAARAWERGSAQKVNALNKEIVILKSEFSTLEMRKKAYNGLITQNKEFIGTVDSEYRALKSLDTMYKRMVSSLREVAIAKGQSKVFEKLGEQLAEVQIQKIPAGADYRKQQQENFRRARENAANLQKAQQSQTMVSRSAYNDFVGDKYLKAGEKMLQLEYDKYNAFSKLNKKEQDLNKQMQAAGDFRVNNIKRLNKEIASGYADGVKLTATEIANKKIALRTYEGLEDEETEKKLGWLESREQRLSELKEKQSKAGSLAEAKRIGLEIAALQKEIDSVNHEKPKKDNKQLAEIFPEGSIKDLDRRLDLIKSAIDTMENNQVRLRKIDKYGNDKDKKGNVLYTGEIVSLEKALEMQKQLQDKRDEQERLTRSMSFQESIDTTEKNWSAYAAIAQKYGKVVADAQYSDLLKGSANYLEALTKEQNVFKNRIIKGDILTPKEKENYEYLEEKLRDLKNEDSPLDAFTKGIERELEKIPSYVGQLDYLESKLQEITGKSFPSFDFFQKSGIIKDKKEEITKAQTQMYNEFINQQETFETKRFVIAQKFQIMRENIGKDQRFDDSERLRLLDQLGRNEAKEYSNAFMEVFEQTDLFEKAFGNLDTLTKKQISAILPQLQKKMEELINLGAPIEQIEKFKEKIDSLKRLSSESSPVKRLIESFKELRKRIKEGTATQEDYDRLNHSLQETKFYTDQAVGAAKEMAEALGIGGAGGPFEKFAKDLTQTIEGLINAIVGYFSGNMQQMVSGIIQMVVGIVKMLSTAGDGKKEKQIREWKRAVDELKLAYEELQRVIEKTAGEEQLQMQSQLIANLREQQRILIDMRNKEGAKKKADQDKIANYNSQINDINVTIQQLVDDFRKSVTTTDFKDLSTQIASALEDAFGKGEDAVKAFDKVVDNVMRNAVSNALRIKILEPAVKQMVDQLYNSMGYGNSSTDGLQAKINEAEAQIKQIDQQLQTATGMDKFILQSQKDTLLQMINSLKQQIAQSQVTGSFDGLTQEERDKIKEMGQAAMAQYMAALQQYEDLFGDAAGAATSMKGDVKGVTEKTAGALEGQINAMRINQVEMLKLKRQSNIFDQKAVDLLTQIEINTRPILWIYEKVKKVIP